MNELTHLEKGVRRREKRGTSQKKSFICPLWQKEWAEEEAGQASVLTVIVMSLKGSIIASRAWKHGGGRGDRKSTTITEGEGGTRGKQMIWGEEINHGWKWRWEKEEELWKSFAMILAAAKIWLLFSQRDGSNFFNYFTKILICRRACVWEC